MALEMKSAVLLCQNSPSLRARCWLPGWVLVCLARPGRLGEHFLAWGIVKQGGKQHHWVSVPATGVVAIGLPHPRPPLDPHRRGSRRHSTQI